MFEASIIIPSHRSEIIQKTCKKISELKSLEQSEVIIVTDYNTIEFEKEFPNFKWFNINNFSIPAKRNYGIKKANSEILAFMDDDCLPNKDWLQQGINFLKNNSTAVGVEGQTSIEFNNENSALLKRFKRLEKAGYRTNNIFYRKSALIEINLFDERFKFQREDTDLAFSLLEKGFKIEFSDQIKVTHLFRKKDRWDLLKNYYNRRYDPLLHKKHKCNYRNHIKTPITKGATATALLYIASIVIAFLFPTHSLLAFLIAFSLIFILFIASGTSLKSRNIFMAIPEFLSFLIAPLILWYALTYGSLRFKNLLLF